MMNNKNIVVKKTLFGCVLIFLFIPLTQKKIHFLNVAPLNGSFSLQEDPYFTYETWLDGNFQSQQQNYINENFGFRNYCVKLHNQIAFSFFNHAKARGVVIGKNNYLYEENYIKAHLGRDFIGEDKINEKIRKLQKIKDTLQNQGIDLIVILAPGKGSFYPEYIPDKYEPNRKTITNYETYCKELKKSSIHFLDLNQWFRDMKETSDYPLFPKTGIHWSRYGELLALDTIANYIESIRKISLAKIHIEHIETSESLRYTDDDLEKGMNLLFNIKDLKMGYPILTINENDSNSKPKVITVADSYYWGLFGSGLTSRLFKEDQFWYYNKKIHSKLYSTPMDVKNINIKKEIEKNDIILLIATDANLYKFSYGFIEQLYAAYFNGGIVKIDS